MIGLSPADIVAQANASGFYTREHGLTVTEVRGKDGLDLLHRLSTNDLLTGSVPRSVRTVFTTEKGRVIDLAEVVVLGNRILLVGHTAAAVKVSEWIGKFTILEEVELLPVNPDLSLYYLLGPQLSSTGLITDALRSPSGAPPSDINCWRSDLGGLPGMRCLVPDAFVAKFTERLSKGGSLHLDTVGFDLIRIMASVPAYSNELNERNHPLEVGLKEAVSFTKGCYVGQEVVARLDAYDKVKRDLRLLHVRGKPDQHAAPWKVSAGETVLGECTSVSQALPDDTTFALALCVRRELQREQAALRIHSGEIEYEASIEIPFWSGSP